MAVAFVTAVSSLALTGSSFNPASAGPALNDALNGIDRSTDVDSDDQSGTDDPAGLDDTQAAANAPDAPSSPLSAHQSATDPAARAVEQTLVQNMEIVPASASQANATCEPDRTFDLAAINVEITLNRFGDHDPTGRMFALQSDIDAIRAEEQANADDRAAGRPVSNVSNGLRDDWIQPLVIRANLGDCVQIELENQLEGERASLHFHRASVEPSQAGSHAGNNEDSTVEPNETIRYTFQIENREELEGNFYFHSHGNTREQTSHGLFGNLIAEPPESVYLDPETGQQIDSGWGWEAIIANEDESVRTFREYAINYHEVGNENFRLRDIDGNEVEQFEQFTSTYRPGSRALSYRSEPFLRRMQQIKPDKPLQYASYTFGDPATPMPRAYLGDPSKTRLTHAGSEAFHSHHLHGGAIRWPFQPKTEDQSRMFDGLDKEPEISLTDTERLDVQNIGPGESYNLEHECGAGGCQQAAGDFLYHCHFVTHYPAGMWGFWRVFDTQQEGLAELPDIAGEIPQGVDSTELIGTTLEDGTTIVEVDDDNDPTTVALADWVEDKLPAQGVPADSEDPTVWDWVVDDNDPTLYLSEEEGPEFWNFVPETTPGTRSPIKFNPDDGKVAYPLVRPHEGQRPPFPPNRDGAPRLRSLVDATGDGEVNMNDHPTNNDIATVPEGLPADSICPSGSPIERFNLVAIDLDIARNDFPGQTGKGEIWVLAEDAEEVLQAAAQGDFEKAHQAALRVNVGDCVEYTIVNAEDSFERRNSRVNIHGHFMQFDTQASDGVITGLQYEQSMYPLQREGRFLTQPASAGDTVLNTNGVNLNRLRPGVGIGVGVGTPNIEVHEIAAIDEEADTITLAEPLVRDHQTDDPNTIMREGAVTIEFHRQTWYMDAEVGTIYWHDHVEGQVTWPRGLFGTFIVQPKGAEFTDPTTGEPVKNAPIADIDCTQCERNVIGENGEVVHLGPGEVESWRDFAFFVNEADPVTGASYNMRAEPLDLRDPNDEAPEHAFSSVVHGDPATPLLRAYEDDPVRIRILHGGTGHTGSHGFRLTGHRFATERQDNASLSDTLTIATSERFDPIVDGGAGSAGDYMYYNAQSKHLREGAWGIFRVHDTEQPNLRPLPEDDRQPPQGDGFPHLQEGDELPKPDNPGLPGEPDVTLNVEAIPFEIGYEGLPAEQAIQGIFVTEEDKEAVLSGEKDPEPLVIRAAAGDLIEVNLTNGLDQHVSLHPGRMEYDAQASQGITVGFNPDQTVAPGASQTLRWRAPAGDRVLGAGILTDFVEYPTGPDDPPIPGTIPPPSDSNTGLYGAIVVSPEGSTFEDPETGEPIQTGWQAIVRNDQVGDHRDFALLFHESDDHFANSQPVMPYRENVTAYTGINYASEPLANRLANDPDPSKVFDSDTHGDPATPIMEVVSGEDFRVHAVYGFGQAMGTFAIEGHRWAYDANVDGSELLSTRAFTPHQTVDAVIDGGAGAPGDYLYMNHRQPYMEAGQWGILRVLPAGGPA